jgi:hypothetical protein
MLGLLSDRSLGKGKGKSASNVAQEVQVTTVAFFSELKIESVERAELT